MGDTKIEWSDKTWNPLAGCEYASPGCRGCYAARDAAGRLSGNPIYAGLTVRRPGELPRFTGEIRLLPDRLDQPLHWSKPCRVFVNSMSDLFHPDVPVDYIGRVFDTMLRADRHQFQVLTKRPKRMAAVLATFRTLGDGWFIGEGGEQMTFPNVGIGTSIENKAYSFRAREVAGAPGAGFRFLSLEPLLSGLPNLDLTGIDWVIVGGESGPQSRPMHPQWARSIRDRCLAAGVPFLFKQAGTVLAREWGMKGAGVDIDEMPEEFRVRQYPKR